MSADGSPSRSRSDEDDDTTAHASWGGAATARDARADIDRVSTVPRLARVPASRFATKPQRRPGRRDLRDLGDAIRTNRGRTTFQKVTTVEGGRRFDDARARTWTSGWTSALSSGGVRRAPSTAAHARRQLRNCHE